MRASRSILLVLTLICAACTTPRTSPAPIIDGHASTPAPQTTQTVSKQAPIVTPDATQYTVKKGDTLFRIAAENRVAYHDLMAWNKLPDTQIQIGQILLLAPPLGEGGVTITPLSDEASKKAPDTAQVVTKTSPKAIKEVYKAQATTASTPAAEASKVASKQQDKASSSASQTAKPVASAASAIAAANPIKSGSAVASSAAASNTSSVEFGMPTSGKVLRRFSEESKGIDIAGKLGQSIVASAQGKVVYAGTGLRGYGKMVILQHSNGYLTAYAHNDKLLVKEGDVVKKGEKIAEMGKSDTDQVKLHFEVRKGGKPVDPGKFIATE